MPNPSDFAAAFLLGWMACASAFWGLHCRSVRKRIDELDNRYSRDVKGLLPLAQKAAANVKGYREEIEDLRALVEAHIRKDDAEAKTMSLALADRIDALATRMDAVELACGLREKPKTMGGAE